MADSPIDVGIAIGRSLNAAAAAIQAATKAELRGAGVAARKEMTRQAGDVPGSDRRFSNMSRYGHGGRLAVNVRGRGAAVFVMSKGPWKLAEEGADPHRIGGGVHPGTRSSQGRRSWTKGQEAVLGRVERTLPSAVAAAVESAFLEG